MAFYTGRTGSLTFDGKPVAKIRDWSLDTTVELLSTNAIDSTVNTFTPGVKGATGSATDLKAPKAPLSRSSQHFLAEL